jgi:hypothetical protein
MEETQMPNILGSETEFGVITEDIQAAADVNGRYSNRVFLRSLDNALFRLKRGEERHACYEPNIEKLANWWREDLSIKDNSEDEIRRCLGFSGFYASNGARIYIDGAHPEYSTPECSSPRDVVGYEKAGEMIMGEIVNGVASQLGTKVRLLKRNWDYHKSSYACHENYCLSRKLFDKLTTHHWWKSLCVEQNVWIMHLITRQIFTGSGRLDPHKPWPECFSLSQRQPFIVNLFGWDTTAERSVINERDRPYADPKQWGRFHVICGDSNRADRSNLLKYGTSYLVLLMLEEVDNKMFDGKENFFRVLSYKSFSEIKNENSLVNTLGGSISALDCQELILEAALRWREKKGNAIPWAEETLRLWSETLAMLRRGSDELSRSLDYFIKMRIFENSLSKRGSLRAINSLDFNYHVIGPGSLFDVLLRSGEVECLVEKDEATAMCSKPPATRAAERAKFKEIFKGNYCAEESWHFLCFIKDGDQLMVELPDPSGGGARIFAQKSPSTHEIICHPKLDEPLLLDNGSRKKEKKEES